jgi:hypothetical protein
MQACMIAGEYLQARRIIRDGLYFAYPDKSHIWRFRNNTFKQTIDSRYASAQPAIPATGPNALPVNNMHQDPVQQTPSEIPLSAFISKSYFLQCEQIAENHAIIVTVEA